MIITTDIPEDKAVSGQDCAAVLQCCSNRRTAEPHDGSTYLLVTAAPQHVLNAYRITLMN
jgi:hypothetical protein